jgi:hypothetical protein
MPSEISALGSCHPIQTTAPRRTQRLHARAPSCPCQGLEPSSCLRVPAGIQALPPCPPWGSPNSSTRQTGSSLPEGNRPHGPQPHQAYSGPARAAHGHAQQESQQSTAGARLQQHAQLGGPQGALQQQGGSMHAAVKGSALLTPAGPLAATCNVTSTSATSTTTMPAAARALDSTQLVSTQVVIDSTRSA